MGHHFKLAAWTSVSDLVTINKSNTEHAVDAFLGKKSMYQQYSIEHVFSTLREAGVDGMELLIPVRTTVENISEVIELTKKYHFPILTLHQSLNSLASISLDEIVRLGEIAKRVGAKAVTLHSGALGKKLVSTSFIATLHDLEEKYGIRYGIENMPKSPLSLGRLYTYNPNAFSYIVKKNDLSVTFDTTHVGQVGGDVLEFYQRNHERIVVIHLSDYQKHFLNLKLLLQNYTHLPLLQGELPINDLLKAIKETKYDQYITMEIKGSLEDLCRSAKIIKGL
jgi:sugar phosphate isomerase/epimerase